MSVVTSVGGHTNVECRGHKCGHKCRWSQVSVVTNVGGHKWWSQMSVVTNVGGHKWWSQM